MAASGTSDEVNLQLFIGQILKTTVRDVLCLLYEELFSAVHPGETPIEVLTKIPKARFPLNQNKETRKRIEDNIPENFDITALNLLLRHSCGLSRNDNAWKDHTKLEGNIEILHQLRNFDAHWTKNFFAGQDMAHNWKKMVDAITKVLELGNLEHHKAKVFGELRHVQELWLATLGKYVQGSMQKELRSLYKTNKKTTLMPILWGGHNFSFNHSVNKTYTETELTTGQGKLQKTLDSKTLLDEFKSLRVVVLQGETGTGKTSLLRHYAATWASAPSKYAFLSNIKILIFLDCTAVTKRTFTVNDIVQEIMPSTCSEYSHARVLKELARSKTKVMIMIDAFDERLDQFQDKIKELQKSCSQAYFLITTRPHCTLSIRRIFEEKTLLVTTHGFNQSCSAEYIDKLFRTLGRTKYLEEFKNVISKFKEIIMIPQLLCWASWYWLEGRQGFGATKGSFFHSITEFMLRKMCYINGKRIMAKELPKEGRQWLNDVSQLAFHEAQCEQVSYNENSVEITKLFESACNLGLNPQEALSSLMQCDSSMKAEGELLVFHFLHDSHANYLVAWYILQQLQHQKAKTLRKFFKGINQEKQKPILLFLAFLMFNKGDVDKSLIQEIARLSEPYVKFYDIRFYLDIIEESGYNETLVKELAKCMPQDTSVSTASEYLRTVNPFGHLWLHPKEFQQNEAVLKIVSKGKPARLWLRLCNGMNTDEMDSISGHKAEKQDAGPYLDTISRAYGNSPLPELRLTDCFISSPVNLPKCVWWLVLERCTISSMFVLSPGLRRITLSECDGLGLTYLQWPRSVTAVKLNDISLNNIQLPVSLKVLTLESCSLNGNFIIPSQVKRLRLIDCEVGTVWSPPHMLGPFSLEDFHIPFSNPNSIRVLYIKNPVHLCLERFGKSFSRLYMNVLQRDIASLRNLHYLSVSNIHLKSEVIIDFLLDFQKNHPYSSLRIESLYSLEDGDDAKDLIIATVMTSTLPQVTVKFRNEVITNDEATNTILKKLNIN